MLRSLRGKSPHEQPSMPKAIKCTEGRMVLRTQPVLRVEWCYEHSLY